MQQVIYIYTLKDPRDDRVRYVGKTNDLKRRYEQHIYDRNGQNPHKDRWIDCLREKGLKPIIEVVEECTDDNWIEREIYWIAKCRCENDDLINIRHGGEGYTSESWRVECVKIAAKRFHLEIKRCFVCGGITISDIQVCSKCMREIDPDYLQSEWYKFIEKDHARDRNREKRHKHKFLRLDAQNNI